MAAALYLTLLLPSILLAAAREIVFSPISPLGAQPNQQSLIGVLDDVLQGSPKYAGLTTFANLDWVHCLSEGGDLEPFDIAFLGAPFDTGTTGRPGARFGAVWDSFGVSSNKFHRVMECVYS